MALNGQQYRQNGEQRRQNGEQLGLHGVSPEENGEKWLSAMNRGMRVSIWSRAAAPMLYGVDLLDSRLMSPAFEGSFQPDADNLQRGVFAHHAFADGKDV